MTIQPQIPKASPQPQMPETRDHAQETLSWVEKPSAPLQLLPGSKPLPDYELVSKLGEGGFGQVWRAVGPGGFEVALKFVKLGESASDTEMKAMQMIKGIRHANLIDLFGVWEQEGWLIVAMGLADRSLLDRFKEAVQQGLQGIPYDELLEYMQDAARGLDFLVEKSIIHRDIKPHNLFMSGNSVKVADYGLAKVLQRTMVSVSTKMTPAYAPPEVIEGKGTKWSDQYSLAITYCHLATGRLPFTGSMLELISAHLTKQPDLSMLPEIERPVVAKALEKEPNKRWPSCKAFVAALVEARMATSAQSKPSRLPSQEIKPRLEDTSTLDGVQKPASRMLVKWLAVCSVGFTVFMLLIVIVFVSGHDFGGTHQSVQNSQQSVFLNTNTHKDQAGKKPQTFVDSQPNEDQPSPKNTGSARMPPLPVLPTDVN
jgi:serine/threonine protein kinase